MNCLQLTNTFVECSYEPMYRKSNKVADWDLWGMESEVSNEFCTLWLCYITYKLLFFIHPPNKKLSEPKLMTNHKIIVFQILILQNLIAQWKNCIYAHIYLQNMLFSYLGGVCIGQIRKLMPLWVINSSLPDRSDQDFKSPIQYKFVIIQIIIILNVTN